MALAILARLAPAFAADLGCEAVSSHLRRIAG